uniref:ADP-ribosylation factor-like protein 6-interacting protein 4 n=1 Tax=Graphocephala atropunctata TaxID=36148 RepID=A0A1B6LI92_9HEMI
MEQHSSHSKIKRFLKFSKDDLNQYAVTKKSKKSKKKSKKRKYSFSSDESEYESPLKKCKNKHKKCKKRHKHSKDKRIKSSKPKALEKCEITDVEEAMIGPDVPSDLRTKAQSMAPMSKAEWDKQQSIIRRVYDEETGRTRLIRGEGEILEEIVSRKRHRVINRQATQGDGEFFQSNLKKWI